MSSSSNKGFGEWFKEEQNKSKGVVPDRKSFLSPITSLFGDIEKGTVEEKSGLIGQINNENNEPACCAFSRTERLKGFTFLLILSVVFFLVAFFIGLPMVLLSPGKFGLSFTIGSLLFMMAFALLEGPISHIKRTCSKDRLPFTTVYILSMALTLWACVSQKSYILTVIFSIIQIIALLWYGLSQAPGGSIGLKFLFSMVLSTFTSAFKSCISICFN